ncbi:MAG: hypothetical protein ACOYWZ_16080 [Bacillota bacterium]
MKKLLILVGLLGLLNCGLAQAEDTIDLGVSVNKLDNDLGIVKLYQININAQEQYVPAWLKKSYLFIGTDFDNATAIGGGYYFMGRCIGLQTGVNYDEDKKADNYFVGVYLDIFKLIEKELK